MSERHILMAVELGYEADNLFDEYQCKSTSPDLLLLEWVEDIYFARFGRYYPLDESATPEGQEQHPAENSLLEDAGVTMDEFLRRADFVPGSDDEPDDWFEEVAQQIKENELKTPVSYGEIYESDVAMLKRQEGFRKAAVLLTRHLSGFSEVKKVLLFGSTALPLWKEVPRFTRLKSREIKVYHECATIDLAVWVTSTSGANGMRKACSSTVRELVDKGVYLHVANHHFCIHLVDQNTEQYLGMVCHFNQCPKHKPECRVTGCGTDPFVRVLPRFNLKPHRLNSHNSQILFAR